MLVDSHCHVNFVNFRDDGHAIIEDFLKTNYALVIVGSQASSSRRAVEYAQNYTKGVYSAVGLHPIDLFDETEESVVIDGVEHTFKNRPEKFDYNFYRDLALSSEKVVAFGEVGFDYYYFEGLSAEKIKEIIQKQQDTLRSFIDLAQELDKPIIFHCRGAKHDPFGAYDDLLEFLKQELLAGKKIRGVIHCFGGNQKQAQEFLNLGFYLGFTGIITFKKTEELQNIVKDCPLDRLLVETDAPFLSPEPYRGQRCVPQYVELVAKKVAELKNLDFSLVAKTTTANAQQLFNI